MAHSNQAKKRNRQNEKVRDHNRMVRSDLRTQIKKFRVASAKKDEAAAGLLAGVESKIDKAAKRNIIPTSRANRIKARLKRAAVKAG
jgi:small subunit ribosomal protein S20